MSGPGPVPFDQREDRMNDVCILAGVAAVFAVMLCVLCAVVMSGRVTTEDE